MSLIIPRNFKSAKAHDAADKDIQLPFIITFNNGKKEFREGYSEEEVRRRFDKSVAALYGGIKSIKLEDEDKRNGKDSVAADAKFKVGEKVRRGVQNGIVRGIEKEPYIEVKFTDEPVTVFVHESEIKAADSRATDAGDATEFHVGQKVRHTRFGTIGRVFEIAPDGGIGVQWSNGQAYYGEFHRPLSEIVAVD